MTQHCSCMVRGIPNTGCRRLFNRELESGMRRCSADRKPSCAATPLSVLQRRCFQKIISRERGIVPYRDCNLTGLLKPILDGGSGRLAIICCVHEADLKNTKNTLEFATDAKKIEIDPKANEKALERQAAENARIAELEARRLPRAERRTEPVNSVWRVAVVANDVSPVRRGNTAPDARRTPPPADRPRGAGGQDDASFGARRAPPRAAGAADVRA